VDARNNHKISRRVTADVLLLAGADDHLVPLKQLARQAGNLANARSVTARTFTAAEQASNHCQVGNVGAAVRVMLAWLDLTETAHRQVVGTASALAGSATAAAESDRR
jgi:hypothetical protein